MNKVALLIRDFENKNLKSNKLYNFIKIINKILLNQNIVLDLYIHTWKYNNTEKWRLFSKKEITEEYIKKYFNNFNIKKIIIEEQIEQQFSDNLISWYSQYNLIKQIDPDYLFLINTSFDLDENINDIIIQILNLIKHEPVKKIYFTKSKCCKGLNNCYYGDYNSMYNLINYFCNNYNNIITKYSNMCYDLIVWKELKHFNYIN
jgi:hypothetical protein